jgi:hypothetical protein
VGFGGSGFGIGSALGLGLGGALGSTSTVKSGICESEKLKETAYLGDRVGASIV